jgi:hypothetical protein
MRLYPGSRTGVVRTSTGRDVPFAVDDVRILGTEAGFAALREGMPVGFDLGRTSRGLRVTVIRVFARPVGADAAGPAAKEREAAPRRPSGQSGSDVR